MLKKIDSTHMIKDLLESLINSENEEFMSVFWTGHWIHLLSLPKLGVFSLALHSGGKLQTFSTERPHEGFE